MEGQKEVVIARIAEFGEWCIEQAAELYGETWNEVYRSEYALKQPKCSFGDFAERESIEFQRRLAEQYADTQLAACDPGGELIGVLNTVPSDEPHYILVPDNWERMLEAAGNKEHNILMPVSIIVRDGFRKLNIGRRMIEEGKAAAIASGYRQVITYSTIIGCGPEKSLEDYFFPEGRGRLPEDPVYLFHTSCGARLVRVMDGDIDRRVRYGFPVAMFRYSLRL
jgi:GNAT superfamily N-acetyltransferase